VLLDAQASRSAILAAIQSQLIDQAKPGDICVFFYAGHGSLIRNLKTNKASGKDSTLVPADAYSGAMDIRDKELSRLFNRALDKGVILTAIFDSCHSGSIARGLPGKVRSRELPPDPRVVSDPPDPGKTPEERGALILSAAQDYETAADSADENGVPHGAFSTALLRALSGSQPNIPAQNLFLSTEVMLQAEQPAQDPVLAGTLERRVQPMFGQDTNNLSGRIVVPVEWIDFDSATVGLQGGQAIGLGPGCELAKITMTGASPNPARIRLRISANHGFDQSTAAVTAGAIGSIKNGDLFEITQWAYPKSTALRVWLPPSELSSKELESVASELAMLHDSTAIEWVDDPAQSTPTRVLARNASGWQLSGVGDLGTHLRAQEVIQRLKGLGETKVKLFVDLPAPRPLLEALHAACADTNGEIKTLATPTNADYFLTGHWKDAKMAYTLIRPDTSGEDGQLSALPNRTDWIEVKDSNDSVRSAASALLADSLSLNRLKAWLALDAHGSTGYFPYHLALRDPDTGQIKANGDTVYDGETYGLALLAETNASLKQVERRWVYVVVIDSWGNTQVIFPPGTQGNVGNHVPYDGDGGDLNANGREIDLGGAADAGLFSISSPFGVDTYVLLASGEPLPDPGMLNNQGVRTRGAEDANPLQKLLGNLGIQARDGGDIIPTDWSVEKLMIQSKARTK
jgi:hypothetical protein